MVLTLTPNISDIVERLSPSRTTYMLICVFETDSSLPPTAAIPGIRVLPSSRGGANCMTLSGFGSILTAACKIVIVWEFEGVAGGRRGGKCAPPKNKNTQKKKG